MPEVTVNDIPIRFPFEPYEVQKNYMRKLIECLQKGQNGVLESPTGTGKTLCLLCASLAWLELKKAENRARSICQNSQDMERTLINAVASQLQSAVGGFWKQNGGCPKIIFSSRTHAQLSQAVNELKKTTYRHMKVSVLGSRDQMCIHPEVSKESNNNNKVHLCQARVKARNCYFYNQVEHKKLDSEVRDSIHDLEDLVKLGRKRTFCPYYMAREIRQDADIIFLPYNYLLDPKSRRAHGIELQGNVVIFDEAHNVEKMCEESASLQLRSTDLALCIDEVTQIMQKLQELAESGTCDNSLMPEDFSIEDLYILKTMFLELEKAVDAITLPTDGTGSTYPGSFMFELLEKADITINKKAIFLDVVDKLIQYLSTNSTSPFQRKGAGLQKFSELIKIVFSKDNFTLSHMEFVKQCYKVHITVEEKRKGSKNDGWSASKSNTLNAKTGKTLSYWCFNPGFGMKDLAEQGIHCIVLTSGTLSPLDAFTSELQIPFHVKLENPHIINPCQVWIGTICKGPDGTVLNSSFQNRSRPEYINSLGQTILNFSRVIPGGLLVFFPSYPIMKTCQDNWQSSGLWGKLNNIKPVFVEPQTKDGFISAMEQFYITVRDPALKGACFMAVCRGKVSEGLDFANRNGRAVIVTGLPYPPFKDPRVVLKQKYLEEVRVKNKQGLTGGGWYKMEASRAVNQAIGRVIRHKDDYGAIILCDKRFGESNFKNELSSWVRPHVQIYESFGPSLRDVIQFFRVTQSMFPEPVVRELEASKSSTKIEYECTATSSNPVVAAAAFEQVGRRVLSGRNAGQGFKPEFKPEPAFHYQPVLMTVDISERKTTCLFTALEKNSSILNFNSVADDDGKDIIGNKIRDANSIIPVKKKIKLVSQSEKDLKHFMNSQSCDQTTRITKDSNEQPRECSPDMFGSGSSADGSQSSSVKIEKPLLVPANCHQSAKSKQGSDNQAKIAKYVKDVKSILSKEEYGCFSEAVKAYKSTRDCDTIIATMLSLFAEKSRYPLLIKFSVFLRPEHRAQLEAIYEDLINT